MDHRTVDTPQVAATASYLDRKIAQEAHGIDDVPGAIDEFARSVTATVYATNRGTTSKPGVPVQAYDVETIAGDDALTSGERLLRGLGLHYVKERTLEFGGTLSIRAGSSEVVFDRIDGKSRITPHLRAPWPGNLIRIALPTVDATT